MIRVTEIADVDLLPVKPAARDTGLVTLPITAFIRQGEALAASEAGDPHGDPRDPNALLEASGGEWLAGLEVVSRGEALLTGEALEGLSVNPAPDSAVRDRFFGFEAFSRLGRQVGVVPLLADEADTLEPACPHLAVIVRGRRNAVRATEEGMVEAALAASSFNITPETVFSAGWNACESGCCENKQKG